MRKIGWREKPTEPLAARAANNVIGLGLVYHESSIVSHVRHAFLAASRADRITVRALLFLSQELRVWCCLCPNACSFTHNNNDNKWGFASFPLHTHISWYTALLCLVAAPRWNEMTSGTRSVCASKFISAAMLQVLHFTICILVGKPIVVANAEYIVRDDDTWTSYCFKLLSAHHLSA